MTITRANHDSSSLKPLKFNITDVRWELNVELASLKLNVRNELDVKYESDVNDAINVGNG
jgi:hypothetical protein